MSYLTSMSTHMHTDTISTSKLSIGFGRHTVVANIEFTTSPGALVVLIGTNGSGKSTLLKTLAGMLKPISGSVKILDGDPGKSPRRVAYLPQHPISSHTLPLRARDVVAMGRFANLGLFNRESEEDKKILKTSLERTGSIEFAEKPLRDLSSGQQQRTHLAQVLARQAEILLLDEPTAAVDFLARIDLWRLIEGLRASGTTILLTSHHLAEAERLCKRVALMRDGRVVAQGSVPELLARVPGQAVAKVQSADKAAIMQRAHHLGWPVRQHADQISLLLPHALGLREIVDALDGTGLSAVRVEPVTLEDAYLELVGDSAFIP
jgi:ABC-type cobalamin/Fe3+-siderophores transport system ATPase subunit